MHAETEPPSDPATNGPVSAVEFHRQIAAELFSQVLTLLERDDRTCAENDRMIHAAHASCFHYGMSGTALNAALGEWQCSRVHSAMGHTESALHHGWRYLEFAETYALGPFHVAYAHLAVAAAFGRTRPEERAQQLALARDYLAQCEDPEEKDVLDRELTRLDEKTPPPASPDTASAKTQISAD